MPATAKPSAGTLVNPAHALAPLSAWLFNEASGTSVADSAGVAAAGTLTGGVTWTTGPGGAPVISCAGASSQYANLGNPASLRFGTGPFSLALRFQLTSFAAVNTLVSLSENPLVKEVQIHTLAADARASCDLYDGSANPIVSAGDISAAGYHTVVLTRGASLLALYVDGALAGSTADSTGSLDATGQTWWIGGRQATTEFFTGQVDYAMLYGRALTLAEVVSLTADPFAPWAPSGAGGVLQPSAVRG